MKGAAISVVSVILLVGSPATAEGPRLSLAQAQAEARAHAPTVAELEAGVRGAQGIAAQASRVLRSNPSIHVGYETGALAGEADEYSANGGLSWTLDVSGSWVPRAGAAEESARRARFDREDGLRALDEQVAMAVAQLANAERELDRTSRISALYGRAAEASRRSLEVGQGDQLQIDAADLDYASSRADVAIGRGNVASAQSALGGLLGRASGSDLLVDDPSETSDTGAPALESMVERDPRVRAAEAELRAARLELDVDERLGSWPAPTFGIGYTYRRREVPAGAFSGPAANGLSATWSDQEVGATLALPLPLFERRQSSRAQDTARILSAQAAVRFLHVTVRTELAQAWSTLQAAAAAYAEVAKVPSIIDREFRLIEHAVRAGALDAVVRAQDLRRLLDSGRRYDAAVLALRVARAKWIRRARP